MNLPKLAAGLAVLAAGLWVLLGEHLAGASADAVVNAQLSTVRSPLEGQVSFATHEVGRAVLAGEVLGSVADRLVDRSRILDLERERAELLVELGRPLMPVAQAEDGQTASDAADRPALSRLDAVEARIGAEQVRLNNLASANLAAAANGLVWQYLAMSGETVARHQDLVRIAACDTAVVTASVSQRLYNSLRIGQAVTFRFDSDAQTYPGTVLRLAGSGAATVYSNMAVAPSAEHLERFDVTVFVPALRDVAGLRCLIGRTGRVFFERRPVDALRAWLSL